jgi:hypothetical protein
MSWTRRFSVLGLSLLLLVGVSCTSADTSLTEAPIASSDHSTPQFGLVGDLTGGLTNTVGGLTNTVVGTLGTVTDLLLCSPQPYEKETATIGPKGGKIKVGTHELEIPKGALDHKVRITAEQVPGRANSLRFSPEGLHFDKPAQLTMSYDNCALVLLQKKIVYTDEDLKIRDVLNSLDLFKKKEVSAPIDHFSRYAVAY